jgi:hypothetical protein
VVKDDNAGRPRSLSLGFPSAAPPRSSLPKKSLNRE